MLLRLLSSSFLSLSSLSLSLKRVFLTGTIFLLSPIMVACSGSSSGKQTGSDINSATASTYVKDALGKLSSNVSPDRTWQKDSEYAGNNGLDLIKADKAYEQGATGAGQTIGFLDTGIAYNHEEFAKQPQGKPKILFNKIANGITTSTDYNLSHGTAVASIAAGSRGSGSQMHGVAYNAQIAMWGIEKNSNGLAITSDAIEQAYRSFSESDVRIVNNSWGMSLIYDPVNASSQFLTASRYFGASIDLMANNRTIYVFSTGNEGADNVVVTAALPLFYEKLLGKFIAVTAIDLDGNIGQKANKCGVASAFCIAAPGESNIQAGYIKAARASGGYQYVNGTSFSSAYVSGALALMREVFGDQLSAAQYVTRLFARANKSGKYADKTIYGQGLLDVSAAVNPAGVLSVPLSDGTSFALNNFYAASVSPTFFKLIQNLRLNSHVIALDTLGDPFRIDLNAIIRPREENVFDDLRMAAIDAETPQPAEAGHLFWSTNSNIKTAIYDTSFTKNRLTFGASLRLSPHIPDGSTEQNPALVGFLGFKPASPLLPSFNIGASIQKNGILGFTGKGAVSTIGVGQSVYVGLNKDVELNEDWRLSAKAQWANGSLEAQGGLLGDLTIERASTYELSLKGPKTTLFLKQTPRIDRGKIRMTLPTFRAPNSTITFRNTQYQLRQDPEYMMGVIYRLSPSNLFMMNINSQDKSVSLGFHRNF
jgi:subtilisin family serine protease